MVVFLDSNLIIDILLPNKEFLKDSKNVLSLAHNNIEFYISAASATDIFYIINKTLHDSEKAKNTMLDLLSIVNIAGVDETCIKNALNSSWADFEDCVQNEVALQLKADYLVTRNKRDYSSSSVVVLSPKDFLERFQQ